MNIVKGTTPEEVEKMLATSPDGVPELLAVWKKMTLNLGRLREYWDYSLEKSSMEKP